MSTTHKKFRESQPQKNLVETMITHFSPLYYWPEEVALWWVLGRRISRTDDEQFAGQRDETETKKHNSSESPAEVTQTSNSLSLCLSVSVCLSVSLSIIVWNSNKSFLRPLWEELHDSPCRRLALCYPFSDGSWSCPTKSGCRPYASLKIV